MREITSSQLLDRRRPHVLGHSPARVVTIGLSAVGPGHVRVAVVHVGGRGTVVRLRVCVRVVAARGGHVLLSRRLPAHVAHVRAAVSATGLLLRLLLLLRLSSARGRLEDRGRSVASGVRSDRRPRLGADRGVGLRGQGGRGARAGLLHLGAQVRRHVGILHVCEIRNLAVHGRHDRHAGSRRHGERAVVRGWSRKRRSGLRVVVCIRANRTRRLLGRARSQSGSSGRRGLLHRTGVVVLVARESRPTSERLLAVGVGALVGALARVDATVTRKRTGIGEGLKSLRQHDSTDEKLSRDSPCRNARTCEASRRCAHVGGRSKPTSG